MKPELLNEPVKAHFFSSRIPPWRRRFFALILAAILAVTIVIVVFLEGQRRGMDRVASALSNDQWTISIALSDLVYGLNAGYLGYATVHNKLVEVWDQGAALAKRDKTANRVFQNDAIRAAMALGPQTGGFVGDRTLITMIYSDIGYVDFAKLAFRIFGYEIESFYYLYFFLLFLSAAAYMLTFRRYPYQGVVLLCALFAFFIELHTTIFNDQMPTFHGMRHGSTLALLPAWHFTFLVIHRIRPSAVTVLAALIQLAILWLAIQTRGSAAWTIVFVLAVAAAAAWIASRTSPPEERTWPRLLRNILRWPVVLLIGGLFAYNQYVKTTLHPVYFTDDVLPYHGLWHTAYAGFWYQPDMIPKNSKAWDLARLGETDQAGYAAASEYLHDTRFMQLPANFPATTLAAPGYISPWTGTIKFKMHDDIMRRVVLQIVKRHPFLAFKLYFYVKPIATVDILGRVFQTAPNHNWLWLLILGGMSAFGVIGIAGGAQNIPQLARTVLPVGGAVPFSALPNIWGYPHFHTIADLLLVTLLFLQLLICAAVVVLVTYRPWQWATSQLKLN